MNKSISLTNTLAKILFGIELLGFVLPFIIEALTNLKAVYYFTTIFNIYFGVFSILWFMMLTIIFFQCLQYKTERKKLLTASSIAIFSLIAPILLVLFIVSHLH